MAHQDITKIALGVASVLVAALYFGARFFINHRGSPTARLAVKTYSHCLSIKDKNGVDSEQYIKCINELEPMVNKLIETDEIKLYRCKPNEKDRNTVFCKVWVWWIPREVMVTNKELVDKVNNEKDSGKPIYSQQPTGSQETESSLGTPTRTQPDDKDKFSSEDQVNSQHLHGSSHETEQEIHDSQGRDVNGQQFHYSPPENEVGPQEAATPVSQVTPQELHSSSGVQMIEHGLDGSSQGAHVTSQASDFPVEVFAPKQLDSLSENLGAGQENNELLSATKHEEQVADVSTGIPSPESQSTVQQLDGSSPETQEQNESGGSDSLTEVQEHVSSGSQENGKESNFPPEKPIASQTGSDLPQSNLDAEQERRDFSSGNNEAAKTFDDSGNPLAQTQQDSSFTSTQPTEQASEPSNPTTENSKTDAFIPDIQRDTVTDSEKPRTPFTFRLPNGFYYKDQHFDNMKPFKNLDLSSDSHSLTSWPRPQVKLQDDFRPARTMPHFRPSYTPSPILYPPESFSMPSPPREFSAHPFSYHTIPIQASNQGVNDIYKQVTGDTHKFPFSSNQHPLQINDPSSRPYFPGRGSLARAPLLHPILQNRNGESNQLMQSTKGI